MQALSIFLSEILISVVISLATIVLIKPVLRNVLIETCGTDKRAEFWMMFTMLMMLISPLLIVILFSNLEGYEYVPVGAVFVVRDALLHSLQGVFVGLVIVGLVIRRSVFGIDKDGV